MTKEMPAPMPTEEAVHAELPQKTASAPPEAAGKKEKFFGIELLRILATFYIILLHVVGQGGVAAASGGGKGTLHGKLSAVGTRLPCRQLLCAHQRLCRMQKPV